MIFIQIFKKCRRNYIQEDIKEEPNLNFSQILYQQYVNARPLLVDEQTQTQFNSNHKEVQTETTYKQYELSDESSAEFLKTIIQEIQQQEKIQSSSSFEDNRRITSRIPIIDNTQIGFRESEFNKSQQSEYQTKSVINKLQKSVAKQQKSQINLYNQTNKSQYQYSITQSPSKTNQQSKTTVKKQKIRRLTYL